MKKAVALFLLVTVVFGVTTATFASDWDVAGKVLAGTEGIRILSGGGVDVLGTIAGINKEKQVVYKHPTHKHCKSCYKDCGKVWIPNYKWKRKWIHTHKEYDPNLGEIVVEGHYIKYKIEHGGRWEYACSDRYSRRHH